MAHLTPLMSSAKHDWGTPQWLFDELHAEFNFTVDAAANESNHKLPRWYGPGGERAGALAAPWDATEVYWCNPPYGRMQGEFVFLGHRVMSLGGLAVFLLPARTDTKMFHAYIWDRDLHKPYVGVQVRFLRGRLKFNGAPTSAPFPSMVVVFDGR